MFFIKSNDNAKIAVYELNPNGKRTIVLVHGWPLSHEMFEYQIPALLNAGYRIVTMDLRGFGNSEVTSAGYNYNQFATDLYCVIYECKFLELDVVNYIEDMELENYVYVMQQYHHIVNHIIIHMGKH